MSRLVVCIIFGIMLTLFIWVILFPYLLKQESETYFQFWSELNRNKISYKRLSVLVAIYVINTVMLFVGCLHFEVNFGTMLLGMLVITQSISVISYELINAQYMKLMPKHFIFLKVFLFFFVASLWAASLYFYSRSSYNTDMSPAKSRESASECLLGGFYDSHDIWHFFSAVALLGNCVIFFHLDLNASYNGNKMGERTGISNLFSSGAFEVVQPLLAEELENDILGLSSGSSPSSQPRMRGERFRESTRDHEQLGTREDLEDSLDGSSSMDSSTQRLELNGTSL